MTGRARASCLPELVTDWGGFEELVADLHRSGTVLVERDVTLAGTSGARRQIDVLVSHHQGPYVFKTIIECKFWTSTVKRSDVDVLASTVSDVNAAKGVMFTTLGYQAGARAYAESKGIQIFVVRDLTDEEWGRPGRVVDFYLQLWSRTVLSFHIPKAQVHVLHASAVPTIRPHLTLSHDPASWVTPTRSSNGDAGKPLEQIVHDGSLQAMQGVIAENSLLINGGEDCTRYFRHHVEATVANGCVVSSDGVPVTFDEFELDLAYRVAQKRMLIDRSAKFDYALAIEDCINGQCHLASRIRGASASTWAGLQPPPNEKYSDDDILQNGSVIRLCLAGYFDSAELP